MTRPNQNSAANAGWRTQFRIRGSRHRPGFIGYGTGELILQYAERKEPTRIPSDNNP